MNIDRKEKKIKTVSLEKMNIYVNINKRPAKENKNLKTTQVNENPNGEAIPRKP